MTYPSEGRSFSDTKKQPFAGGVGGVQRFKGDKRLWHGAGVLAGERLGDLEEHDVFSQILTAHRVGSGRIVNERETFALTARKVDDYVETFAWRDEQVMKFEWRREKPSIAADLLEGRDIKRLARDLTG